MKKYVLYTKDLKRYKGDFNWVIVNKDNFQEYIDLVQESIDMFNKKIEWGEMFDINIANYRLIYGSSMYIGINNGTPFGYFWSKPYLNGYFIYNVFVEEDQPIRGKYFMSTMISELFPKTRIFITIDEWNVKSIKMFESIGFIKTSW